MTSSTTYSSTAFSPPENPLSYGENSFTSTGKERDAETGYGYFGARYMDHELMTGWLSVDPKSDKYPSMSPYNYCAWNPVKLVDPDGMEIDDYKFNKSTGELTLIKKTDDNFDLIEIDDLFVQVSKGILNGRDVGDVVSMTGFEVTDPQIMEEAVNLVWNLSVLCQKEIGIVGYGDGSDNISKIQIQPWNNSDKDRVSFSDNLSRECMLFMAHTHPDNSLDPNRGTATPGSMDGKLAQYYPVDQYILSYKQGLGIYSGEHYRPQPNGNSHIPVRRSTPKCLRSFIQ